MSIVRRASAGVVAAVASSSGVGNLAVAVITKKGGPFVVPILVDHRFSLSCLSMSVAGILVGPAALTAWLKPVVGRVG